jgi:hypothetical protein
MWHSLETPVRGGGVSRVHGVLHYERYGCPNLGVCIRWFEGSNMGLGSGVVEDPSRDFSGVQGGFGEP